MDARVSAEGLGKDFGDVRALDDVSFSAGAGEILGILGPNGAGKTTALHILLGILKATRGSVRVLGHSPAERRYEIYPRINFTSAYVQLPFNLTVERGLRIFADLYAVENPRRRVAELMERLGVEKLAGSRIGGLSSGEQTRVNLAKSLLNDPEVLFLDEPTASLDPDIADRVRGLLKGIRAERGVTMLYTSHNMAEVETLCDRILFLHHGKVIAQGTSEEVRRAYGETSLEGVFLKLSREAEGGKA